MIAFARLAVVAAGLEIAACGAPPRPTPRPSPLAATAPGAPSAPATPELRAPAVAPAAGSPLAERMQTYARARAALATGRDADAERELAATEKTLPELADYALIDGARLARRRGDDATARERYDRLLAEHQDSVWLVAAATERGDLALASGDAAGAAASYARAVAGGGEKPSPAALLGQARAAAALGDAAGAYRTVDPLRGSAGEVGDGARDLGEELAARGAPALGLDTGDLALRQAAARLREGRTSEAADALAPLLVAGSPRRGEALLVLARIRMRQGATDEAFATWEESSRASSSPDVAGVALYERGRALWNRNDDEAAARDFEELLRRFPEHPKAAEAGHALGRIAESRGDMAEAARRYDEVARLHPGDPLARELAWRAGFVRHLGGDSAAAAATFAALDGEDAAYWRARAIEAGGDRAQARELYTRLADGSDEYLAGWVEERLGEAPLAGDRTRPRPALGDAPSPDALDAAAPALAGAGAYHLTRGEILRALGLRADAAREYAAVEDATGPDPMLLERYREVGAYPAMVRLARRLESTHGKGSYEAYLYPRVYREEFAAAGRTAGVDPLLLLAVSRQESLFDAAARSPAGARGLMQLMPATAAEVAGPDADTALVSPAMNTEVGARHLRDLLDRYDGRIVPALAAYNAGPAPVARWQERAAGRDGDELVEIISYRETKGYVKAVLRNYRIYLAQDDRDSIAPLRLD